MLNYKQQQVVRSSCAEPLKEPVGLLEFMQPHFYNFIYTATHCCHLHPAAVLLCMHMCIHLQMLLQQMQLLLRPTMLAITAAYRVIACVFTCRRCCKGRSSC
jgi:hypothetical protein